AALDVPQDRDARVETRALGDLTLDALTDRARDDLTELADLRRVLHRGALGRHGALGDDDDRERGVRAVAVLESLDDLLDVEGLLRGQDDLGPARDARGHRDPPRVTAHDLDDHDPVVRLGGRVDAIDRLGRDRHGRVEADRAVGPPHVVVDRLGDADDPHPGLGDLVRRVHRAVPADAYEGLDLLRLERRADRLEPALGAVRVEPRRARHRPAERQDVAHVRAGQVVHVTLDHAAPAVAESDDRVPVRHPVLDDGPDGRVEAGDVATAGEQTDSHA